jgi:hypothetical protein
LFVTACNHNDFSYLIVTESPYDNIITGKLYTTEGKTNTVCYKSYKNAIQQSLLQVSRNILQEHMFTKPNEKADREISLCTGEMKNVDKRSKLLMRRTCSPYIMNWK